MNDRFSPSAAAVMPDGARRHSLAEAAQSADLPSTEAEEWRYSPIGDLPLEGLVPSTEPPSVDIAALDRYDAVVIKRAATVCVVDGWVIDVSIEPEWSQRGLEVFFDAAPAAVENDDEQTRFDLLHRAFSPGAVHIRVPTGLSVRAPIVIVNHQSSVDTAVFPHVIVEAGNGSDVVVLERQTSADGYGLSVPVVELRAETAARLRYQTVQQLHNERWQLSRLYSSAADQSMLACGVAAFGARYARSRADGRLTGRGSTGNMMAAYYGDGDQIHDFRVFQHHDAPDSRSDLLFKGAQDDASGSIYTGMIHIHPDGAGSNASQTNRNVKLSPDAWAWSVPNLEIENDDVHCNQTSTVSPIHEDRQFDLQASEAPPTVADRLVVAGFFDEVIGRLPVADTHAELRRQVGIKFGGRQLADELDESGYASDMETEQPAQPTPAADPFPDPSV